MEACLKTKTSFANWVLPVGQVLQNDIFSLIQLKVLHQNPHVVQYSLSVFGKQKAGVHFFNAPHFITLQHVTSLSYLNIKSQYMIPILTSIHSSFKPEHKQPSSYTLFTAAILQSIFQETYYTSYQKFSLTRTPSANNIYIYIYIYTHKCVRCGRTYRLPQYKTK